VPRPRIRGYLAG
jgi:hypothetical protein